MLLKKESKGSAVKELQENLIALKYDLPVYGADGHYGEETEKAVQSIQSDYKTTVDGLYGANTNAVVNQAIKYHEQGKLSEHFWYDEFRCNGTGELPENGMDRDLINRLEELRKRLGNVAIEVTSGYRSPSYNRKVGGVSNSQHLYGKAADIVVPGVSASEVYNYADKIFNDAGLGKYENFTHTDCRGYKARW